MLSKWNDFIKSQIMIEIVDKDLRETILESSWNLLCGIHHVGHRKVHDMPGYERII